MAGQGPRIALLVSIGLLGLWFLRALLSRLRQAAGGRIAWVRSTGTSVTGFVTTFFDTLGIGNFATTTTIFCSWHWAAQQPEGEHRAAGSGWESSKAAVKE